MAQFPAPTEGIAIVHFIVSRDVERSRRFYTEVLGGEAVLEGELSIVALANGWVTISVSGDTVPFATTTSFDVTQPQTMVLALVDSKGTVHFSRSNPSEGKPCRAYPAVRPTDMPIGRGLHPAV